MTQSGSGQIDTVMQENRLFAPSEEFKSKSAISSLERLAVLLEQLSELKRVDHVVRVLEVQLRGLRFDRQRFDRLYVTRLSCRPKAFRNAIRSFTAGTAGAYQANEYYSY